MIRVTLARRAQAEVQVDNMHETAAAIREQQLKIDGMFSENYTYCFIY